MHVQPPFGGLKGERPEDRVARKEHAARVAPQQRLLRVEQRGRRLHFDRAAWKSIHQEPEVLPKGERPQPEAFGLARKGRVGKERKQLDRVLLFGAAQLDAGSLRFVSRAHGNGTDRRRNDCDDEQRGPIHEWL